MVRRFLFISIEKETNKTKEKVINKTNNKTTATVTTTIIKRKKRLQR